MKTVLGSNVAFDKLEDQFGVLEHKQDDVWEIRSACEDALDVFRFVSKKSPFYKRVQAVSKTLKAIADDLIASNNALVKEMTSIEKALDKMNREAERQ